MKVHNSYRAYFKLALYPENTKQFTKHNSSSDDDSKEETLEETFTKYLCSDEQSKAVLHYLNIQYIKGVIQNSSNYLASCDLKYNGNGHFNCKVVYKLEDGDILDKEETEEMIDIMIWPGNIQNDVYITINNEQFRMEIELDYYEINEIP